MNIQTGASQFLFRIKRIILSLRSLRTEGWRNDVRVACRFATQQSHNLQY
jgi:hypothetical protein